jgi:hypothetical protein
LNIFTKISPNILELAYEGLIRFTKVSTFQNKFPSLKSSLVKKTLQMGDLVFFTLQPYRNSSMKKSGAKNLNPYFYGPYRVVQRTSRVAYGMELLEGSKIHNVFHVSCIKKELGQRVTNSVDLPPLDKEGKLVLVLEEVLEVWDRKL